MQRGRLVFSKMNPSTHIFFGLLFSAFLFFLFPETGIINISLIFLSSVLIDVDHYLYYAYKKKSINLKEAYDYFMEHKTKKKEIGGEYCSPSVLCILHGAEVLLIIFVLSFFFKPLYFIFIGFSFHLLLDMVEQAIYSEKFEKFSLVNDFLNYKA